MPQFTILLADDEPHITHLLANKLRGEGYVVHTASDGEEAFELAIELLPDLLITDLQMPYMSGLELCQKLKETPDTSSIPAIMLRRGFLVQESELSNTNVQHLISKPFSAARVVEKTLEVLGADTQERNAA